MQPTAWTPEPFEADDGTTPFERFLTHDLSDFKAAALVQAIQRVLAVRGMELASTSWLKPLGGGLFEFRVRHTADEIAQMFGDVPSAAGGAPESVLLRLFVHFYGDKVILLFGGYDKGDDVSQKRQDAEIAQARKLLTQFKERQRRLRKEEHPAGQKPKPAARRRRA